MNSLDCKQYKESIMVINKISKIGLPEEHLKKATWPSWKLSCLLL